MKAKLALALVALAVGLIASPLGAEPSRRVVERLGGLRQLDGARLFRRLVPLDNNCPDNRDGVFNSDLAFQDDMVVQGTYGGFRAVAHGDFGQAATFFAPGAIIDQGRPFRLPDRAAARIFNAGLPCHAELIALDDEGA